MRFLPARNIWLCNQRMMLAMKQAKPSDPEGWPVVWRVVFLAPTGETVVCDEVADEREARLSAIEKRRQGWPVRLEKVALQPLPDRAIKRAKRLWEAREARTATRN